MTAQELMQPRFEVIADYPYCPVKVNEQLERVTETLFIVLKIGGIDTIWHLSEIEKMPHIFKKLNWWEKRNIEDMPKRLISRAIPGDTEIIEIEEWDMQYLIGWIDKKKKTCADLALWNPEFGYIPID